MTRRPCHILLVDDDDVTNFLSKEMLRLDAPDTIIDTTMNGKEALEYLLGSLSGTLPDIILLDINMPVMDGWDFLAHFESLAREHNRLKGIRIFMFTSSVYKEDMDRAMTYSSVRKIYSKPLDNDKISEIVAVSVGKLHE